MFSGLEVRAGTEESGLPPESASSGSSSFSFINQQLEPPSLEGGGSSFAFMVQAEAGGAAAASNGGGGGSAFSFMQSAPPVDTVTNGAAAAASAAHSESASALARAKVASAAAGKKKKIVARRPGYAREQEESTPLGGSELAPELVISGPDSLRGLHGLGGTPASPAPGEWVPPMPTAAPPPVPPMPMAAPPPPPPGPTTAYVMPPDAGATAPPPLEGYYGAGWAPSPLRAREQPARAPHLPQSREVHSLERALSSEQAGPRPSHPHAEAEVEGYADGYGARAHPAADDGYGARGYPEGADGHGARPRQTPPRAGGEQPATEHYHGSSGYSHARQHEAATPHTPQQGAPEQGYGHPHAHAAQPAAATPSGGGGLFGGLTSGGLMSGASSIFGGLTLRRQPPTPSPGGPSTPHSRAPSGSSTPAHSLAISRAGSSAELAREGGRVHAAGVADGDSSRSHDGAVDAARGGDGGGEPPREGGVGEAAEETALARADRQLRLRLDGVRAELEAVQAEQRARAGARGHAAARVRRARERLVEVEAAQAEASSAEAYDAADALSGALREAAAELADAERELGALAAAGEARGLRREALLDAELEVRRRHLAEVRALLESDVGARRRQLDDMRAELLEEGERLAVVADRLATDEQRLASDVGELAADEGTLTATIEGEAADAVAARDVWLAQREAVGRTIAGLRAQLQTAKLEAMRCDEGAQAAEAEVHAARLPHARQLQRLALRRAELEQERLRKAEAKATLERQRAALGARAVGEERGSGDVRTYRLRVEGAAEGARAAIAVCERAKAHALAVGAGWAAVQRAQRKAVAAAQQARDGLEAVAQQTAHAASQLASARADCRRLERERGEESARLPELEEAKRLAVAQRAFKDAARTAAAVKEAEARISSAGAELEQTRARADGACAQLDALSDAHAQQQARMVADTRDAEVALAERLRAYAQLVRRAARDTRA
ncbi:hypothetical protein T492DRAFT_1149398, partial [Pavlovales sp. CCMP2436]